MRKERAGNITNCALKQPQRKYTEAELFIILGSSSSSNTQQDMS
jgi:hypothetical protein